MEDEYYLLFFEDGAPDGILERRRMLNDMTWNGYRYRTTRGAERWNHGMWLIMEDYAHAWQILINYHTTILRVQTNGEVFEEDIDGSLEYKGRCVLKNKAEALENGDWFEYDDLTFSIEEQ